MGLSTDFVRQPLLHASESCRQLVDQAMDYADLLEHKVAQLQAAQ